MIQIHPHPRGRKCSAPPNKWIVTAWKCNHSAFNGYRQTSSDYSEVTCTVCQWRWRTKAAYVDELCKGAA